MLDSFGGRQRSPRAKAFSGPVLKRLSDERRSVAARPDHAAPSFPTRPTRVDSISERKANRFLGRSRKQWGQCCLCYAVFYIVLFGIFVCMMSLYFLHVVDKNSPRHYLEEGFLQMPGINVRPKFSNESTLLRFIRSNASQVNELREAVQDYLRPYNPDNQVGDRYMDCIDGRSVNDYDKACTFKTHWLGDCNLAVDFGYEDGSPCLFMRLNKVYMWQPENYEPEEVPEEIRSVWQKDVVTLTCDGAMMSSATALCCAITASSDRTWQSSTQFFTDAARVV